MPTLGTALHWIACTVAVAWLIQAWLMVWRHAKFLSLLKRPERPWHAKYEPHAVVILPIKGVDEGLADALAMLLGQDYPDYEVVFVVEDDAEPALDVIRRVGVDQGTADDAAMSGCAGQVPWRIIVSGRGPDDRAQKVHNQLIAMAQLDEQAGDDDVWLFADSDAVPHARWLGDMVKPLAQWQRVGCTTGYRWMIPEPDAPWATDWISVINSSVISFLGRYQFNRAWGGSMAMRVFNIRRGGLRQALAGAISDDFTVSRVVNDMGLLIRFVPTCLIASPTSMPLGRAVEFVRRQYTITRICAGDMYLLAFFGTMFYSIGLAISWTLLIAYALGASVTGHAAAIAAGCLVGVALANQCRSSIRRAQLRQAFGDAVAGQMKRVLSLDRWGTSAWMIAHGLLVVSVMFKRTITWRGITYRLRGCHQVKRL